jgi:large subunit ribosomal protein L5
MAYVPRFLTFYKDNVVDELRKEFGYKNVMQVPLLEKITLNIGLGEAVVSASAIEAGLAGLAVIGGQKPIVTKARKSIANFKLRAGMSVGVKATLRGAKMWDFFDRLLNIALPRVRDFRGLSPKAFDGRGNYSVGIREEIIFPEIDFDKLEKALGLSVVINTTAKTDEEGRALLAAFGFPFRKV